MTADSHGLTPEEQARLDYVRRNPQCPYDASTKSYQRWHATWASCRQLELQSSRAPPESLVDRFAMAALPALIARHRADVAWGDVAPRAYEIARAMMAERTKPAQTDKETSE